MKNKISIFLIIVLSVFFINYCKRSEYTAPDFTGPAVKDLYAMMNVGKTVLSAGENTTVMVKVLSNLGPIKGVTVSLVITTYDGTSYSKFGSLDPVTGKTDDDGIFRSTLYAPDVIFGLHYVKVVAHVSGDPYLFNNRILTADAVVVFSE